MNARIPATAPPQSKSASKVTPAPADANAQPLLSIDSAIFRDIKVTLRVKLGEVTLPVDELLALKSGSTLKLDRLMSELVELHLNDALVARGEIVAVDDNFGVRIIEIAPAA